MINKGNIAIIGIGKTGADVINNLIRMDDTLGTFMAIENNGKGYIQKTVKRVCSWFNNKLDGTLRNFSFIFIITELDSDEELNIYRQIIHISQKYLITLDSMMLAPISMSFFKKNNIIEKRLKEVSRNSRMVYYLEDNKFMNGLPIKLSLHDINENMSRIVYLNLKNLLGNITPFINKTGKVGCFWYIEATGEWITSWVPVEEGEKGEIYIKHQIVAETFWENSEYKDYGYYGDFLRGQIVFSHRLNCFRVFCSREIEKKAKKFLLEDGWFGWPLKHVIFARLSDLNQF